MAIIGEGYNTTIARTTCSTTDAAKVYDESPKPSDQVIFRHVQDARFPSSPFFYFHSYLFLVPSFLFTREIVFCNNSPDFWIAMDK